MSDPARSLAAALARLDQRVDWESRDRSTMQVDLQPVTALLDRLGRPQLAYRTVHVTGSKGKGSVCALVAAGLRAAGLRAACCLSPHVETINERVLIDGVPIDDDALAHALHAALDALDDAIRDGGAAATAPDGNSVAAAPDGNSVAAAPDGNSVAAAPDGNSVAGATRFDLLTAAAFCAARDSGAEWCVVEVGLGGRDDSTNVLMPEVAVITGVALEHTEVLGPTIADIAAHKAGIVKPGCTLVTTVAPGDEAGPAIHGAAAAQGVAVRVVVSPAEATISARNRALARAVLDELGRRGVVSPRRGLPLSASDLGDADADASALPGRLERLSLPDPAGGRARRVVVDGAHVDVALHEALRELQLDPALHAPPVVLLALAADKPAARLLDVLRGRVQALVAVPLRGSRAGWSPQALATLAAERGLPVHTAADAEQGLALGLDLAGDGWVLATGSLQLVGEVRAVLRKRRGDVPALPVRTSAPSALSPEPPHNPHDPE